MEEREYWYWFCNLKGIGIRKMNGLLTYFKDPVHLFEADYREIAKLKFLTPADMDEVINKKEISKIKRSYETLLKKNIQFITIRDKNYPEALKHIPDAPIALYIRGDLPQKNMLSLAIVGARNCSNYGKEIAFHMANQLSKAGIQIISGLANGVDSCAHKGSLAANIATYGVLGCGIDICYPISNIEIYMRMQECGGIISEYSIGMPAKPGNFPMRNRIISGLCDGVLIVEAKEKSGSLITADLALEHGKDVFAIPGRICDKSSKGCNNLIKMGAILVDSVEDILNYYNIMNKNLTCNHNDRMNLLSEDEINLLNCIEIEPRHINQIVEASNYNLLQVINLLSDLEKKEIIRQTTKNFYSRYLKID